MNKLKTTVGIACLLVVGMLASKSFAGEMIETWKGYPVTATKQETKLLIERRVPKTVRPKKAYTYELKITNRSYYNLDEVVLIEKLPSNFTVIKISPEPDKKSGNALRWEFGLMAPGQKEVITITGKANRAGTVVHRGQADLNFHLGQMTAIMEVVNPSLLFTIEAPKNLIVGDDFKAVMTFTNNGTAAVLNTVLDHELKGVRKASGGAKLHLGIDKLMPSKSKTFEVRMHAYKKGDFTNILVAKANDGVAASAKMTISVKQPKLRIAGTAPAMRYVGNNIGYKISLKNIGDGDAQSLQAVLKVPAGMRFISANEGGANSGGAVSWNLVSLPAGESKELTAKLQATRIMKVAASATAQAKATALVSTTFLTDVQGIPALLLRVDDVNDPVAVGETETYKIYVTNTGSLAAKNVAVTCMLEDSMRVVSSEGPTKAVLKGKQLVFPPLRSLDVGGKAVWTVVVKALKEGDVRFGASVRCEQLDSPVAEFESTNFYE
ncbi:MAG: DUF11 domain-containing protein [Kiritimatiellaeota bacterium]|nr:DUF11 domain-containing protein [Kiritimatiellota bacterium]